MKLIVGLGNPGRSYAATRHNVGWWVVDYLRESWGFDAWRKQGQALVSSGRVASQSVRLMKPQTFMNLSGDALIEYARRPAWDAASDLLVILDEVALPVGTVRLRARGSAGGHNGLKSVEATLASREYARLRIGIRPDDEGRTIGDLADFVLGPFSKTESATIIGLLARIRDAIEIWLRDGVEAAMNEANSRRREDGTTTGREDE